MNKKSQNPLLSAMIALVPHADEAASPVVEVVGTPEAALGNQNYPGIHTPARYRWPDPVNDATEVRRLFGDNPPANLRSSDVFSGGSFGAGAANGGTFYVFHILNDQLIAAHHDIHG